MKKSGKNFFYLDEQSSSEEYEDEFPKNDSVTTEQPVEFTTRTRLQRKPSFRYPK